MASHALLAPSSASRWLTCTKSARLEEGKTSSSDYADEGTLAHTLSELLLRYHTGQINKALFTKELKVVEASKFYDDDMYSNCEDYAHFVIEQYTEAIKVTEDSQLYIEKKIDLHEYVPESYGTTDAAIVSEPMLTIIDLKYGKGISVDAYENQQMMLYALGVLIDFSFMYDIHVVRMIIYQPRLNAVSTFEMKAADLFAWGETVVKPKAKLAWEGKGEFVPGEHCRFCKIRNTCGALAEHNLEIAKYEFAEPVTLTDKELINIFQRAATFENWLNAVKEYMLDQALNHSKKWKGLKLVEGRSNRKFTDENEVLKKLLNEGYGMEHVTKTSVLGITALNKLMGKKEFESVLNDLLIKPPGTPALVNSDDPRSELNSLDQARKEFI